MNSNQPEDVTEVVSLSMDLHEALQQVPLSIDYYEKLELYSEKLIQDYNWHKRNVFNTIKELDDLPIGTRVTTAHNSLAVKHKSGWVILTQEGYTTIQNFSSDLALPVYSIPEVSRPTETIKNDQQATETLN